MKAFIIDVSRCNGCYRCQIFCKAENATPSGTPISGLTLNNITKIDSVVAGVVAQNTLFNESKKGGDKWQEDTWGRSYS